MEQNLQTKTLIIDLRSNEETSLIDETTTSSKYFLQSLLTLLTTLKDELKVLKSSVRDIPPDFISDELRVEIQRMEKQIVDVDNMIIDILDRTYLL